jgi:tetrapyrrole methylase family protein/MazG family protein
MDDEASVEVGSEEIIARILNLAREGRDVVYAVPGHPFMGNAICPEVFRRAKSGSIAVRVIDGISILEPVCTALGLAPLPKLILRDALEMGHLCFPDYPADMPALFTRISSREVAAELKLTLTAFFPDEHPVKLVHGAGTELQLVEDIPLYEIDRSEHIDSTTVLYVSPLKKGTSFESFQEVIARLRAPDGCPWDREQTYLSLRKHLLEETYEALAAMDQEDPEKMAEEFGDLLLQIVLNAQIGFESGDFTMKDVIQGIHDKIIRRHPHVFGNTEVDGVGKVLSNWEKLKAEERKSNGQEHKSLLDGVMGSFPALTQAQELQDRAARVGFDWKDESGVLDKMHEELNELANTRDDTEFEEELGDLLFAVVNLARWRKVDAESALRATSMKFRKRFNYIEEAARKSGRQMSELTFDELNDQWEESKRKLK